MKILNWAQFAAMPEGTIYSHWEPNVTTGLYRKGKTLYKYGDDTPVDFWCASVMAQWPAEDGMDAPPCVDPTEIRWFCDEYDQLFAVYEAEDIKAVAKMLGVGQ